MATRTAGQNAPRRRLLRDVFLPDDAGYGTWYGPSYPLAGNPPADPRIPEDAFARDDSSGE